MSSLTLRHRTTRPARLYLAAFTAGLLLSSSTVVHATVSDAEFARVRKLVDELQAQVRTLKGGVAQARAKANKTSAKVDAFTQHPIYASAPAGAQPTAATQTGHIPFFATESKQIQFGRITITPGGFVDAEAIWRSRDLLSDGYSNISAIPFNNSNLAHVNENRFTARGSRVALLAEAPISNSLFASAYGELDFNASAATSNLNQYEGYVPRFRQAYATLDEFTFGLHLLVGQAWSLITPNSKGITPRNEVAPPLIDYYFLPGLMNARTPQVRLVKDFDKKLWLALSVESASTAYPANCNAVVSNTSSAAVATGSSISANSAANIAGGTCQAAASSGYFGGAGANSQLTLNKMPDIMAKAAYEMHVADRDVHLETTGIFRNFTDYVNYGTLNAVTGYTSSKQQNTAGWGLEAGLVVPVIPKRLDFQTQGTIGRGLGRYTNTGLPDAAINGNGAFKPVGTQDAFASFTGHITPALDAYVAAGFEQAGREYSSIGGTQVGYGQLGGINNYGCNALGGTCQAQTHRVWQITGGFWDKIYKGDFGEVRVGTQYSYTVRQAFAATSNADGIPTAAAPLVAPHQNEHIVMTSFRYYPFQ